MSTMEKPGAGVVGKSKIKFLMFLPKPASTSASAVSLQNQNQYLFSPGKINSNRLKSHQNKAFSGPITSVVLEEARNKSSSSRFDASKEPTSPKISCMGQIKHRKKKKISKNKTDSGSDVLLAKEELIPNKKKNPGSRNVFRRAKQERKSSAAASTAEKSSELPDRAPCLSQMKRFASARETLSNFDYNKAQVAPEDPDDPRYYSGESSEEEDREVIIPFSAPILRAEVGQVDPAAKLTVEPRKEINLWKRRTMAQPKPLQLNSLVTSCKKK